MNGELEWIRSLPGSAVRGWKSSVGNNRFQFLSTVDINSFWVNLKHILVAESDQLCEISLASHSFMEANLVKANCWNFVGDTTKVIRIFVGQ